MLNLDAVELAQLLSYADVIDALEKAFKEDISTPERGHHTIPVANSESAQLLLMPAWQEDEIIGVKLATVFPNNAKKGLASVNASYTLFYGETGEMKAQLNGNELTLRRTAAASVLASKYLSRKNAQCLLMVGTGQLASHLIRAHASVRKINKVLIWVR